MDGVAEQRAARIQQAEVHAPGVHGQAGQRSVALSRGDARADLCQQRQDVPVEAGWQPHRPVREAVHLVDGQAVAVEGADDRPAALGAQVQREIPLACWHACHCRQRV
jgi:hypothetical protein